MYKKEPSRWSPCFFKIWNAENYKNYVTWKLNIVTEVRKEGEVKNKVYVPLGNFYWKFWKEGI